MPTTLGNRYLPTWRGYPPHMSQDDYPLWQKYKNEALKDAIAVYYDVGLGGQAEVPEGVTPDMALMWLRNTQKRADVVIETTQEWKIIELRSQATGAALGRLLMYRDLWKKDPPDSKPVSVLLVTDRYDNDVLETAKAVDVQYVTV